MINCAKIVVSCFLLMFILNCTENPFFKDDPIQGNSIEGRVTLSDGESPDNVFIWMEDWNVGTFTNSEGKFKLTLSGSGQSGMGNGYSKLYLYVNNYYTDSAKVLFANGNLRYGEGDVNDNGELKSTRKLEKYLEIAIDVEPAVISTNYEGDIKFTTTLKSYPDSTRICTKFSNPLVITSAFITPKNAATEVTQEIDNGGKIYASIPVYHKIKDTEYKRQFTMTVPYDATKLPPGEYRFVPFVYATEYRIPGTLSYLLGENLLSPHADFLKLPMKRSGGEFTVTE